MFILRGEKKKEAVSRLVCDLIYTYSDALLNEE